MIHWVLASGALDVVKFSIKTGTAASTKQLVLGNWTTPYDCVIDWGDGSTTKVTSNTQITHAYAASSTTYQIKIIGKCGGFWNGSTRLSGYALVTSLDEVHSNSLKSLLYTFYNCTALTTLPAVINAPNLTNCQYAFYGCTANTSAYPKLWLTNPGASGGNCFTKCFAQTMYKQYGTKCPRIGAYHAATPSKTYSQQYGYYSCPKRTYYTVSLPSATHASGCTHANKTSDSFYTCTGGCNTAGTSRCSCGAISWATTLAKCSSCNVVYSSGSSAYYSCGSAVGNSGKCTSACKIAYTLQSSQLAAVAAGWTAYA